MFTLSISCAKGDELAITSVQVTTRAEGILIKKQKAQYLPHSNNKHENDNYGLNIIIWAEIHVDTGYFMFAWNIRITFTLPT